MSDYSAEVLPPEHGLARVDEAPSDGIRQMEAAAERVRLQLELKWEEERKERERWSLEDKRDAFYARLVSHMAAAVIAEGAAGARPSSRQVAEMATEYADAIIGVLDARAKRRAEEKQKPR